MELALQKLSELREVAPDETADLLDALATLFVLRQDISNPMYGAKVMYHTRPPEENRVVDPEEVPEDAHYVSDPFEKDGGEKVRYRRKKNPGDPDLISRRAIVFDPTIAEADADTTYWDPNLEEYTTPDDYPLGTVNLVVAEDEDRDFGIDYTYGVRVETSVTPADGEPAPHTYTPGWDDPPDDNG